VILQVYGRNPVEDNTIHRYRWKVLYGVATLGEVMVMVLNVVERDCESMCLDRNLGLEISRRVEPLTHIALEGNNWIVDLMVDLGDGLAVIHSVEVLGIDYEEEDSRIAIPLENNSNGHHGVVPFVSNVDFRRNFVCPNRIYIYLHHGIENARYH
jgi:hypothetical protein